MREDSIFVSKFEAAERQLNQAIELFFNGGDPIAVHTLSEAAAQILYDIKGEHGGVSLLRDNDRIRPERRKEWLSYVFKSRNFFKHADRDKNETHEFKPIFNHFSLLDAVSLYLKAEGFWTPETLNFFAWFSLAYPHLLQDDSDVARLVQANLAGPKPLDPTDFKSFGACIREMKRPNSRFKLPQPNSAN